MVSDERFDYWRCDVCGVVRLRGVPERIGDYYPGDYHELMTAPELAVAAIAEAPRVELLRRHVEPGQMVEIGPSQGVFASAAKAAGFDITALEMDERCCTHLGQVVGVRAIHTVKPEAVLPELPPSRAIVMWHVIEHVPDPWSVLRAIAANLEPGGVLALATPNPESLQAKMLGTRWLHLDAPRHLTLIPFSALEDEAGKLGLEVEEVTATDPVGLGLNRLGWERTLLRPPALRPHPRFAYTVGRGLTALAAPMERRGLRGTAYTAVLRKQ